MPDDNQTFPSDEQERVQKKTFLNWINAHLARVSTKHFTSQFTEEKTNRMGWGR